MTPSGVEHIPLGIPALDAADVIQTMTPSGVEHSTVKDKPRTKEWSDPDDDALGR